MKEVLKKLMEKKITPKECLELLNISKNELDELLILEGYKSTRHRLSISNINKMHYLDINKYWEEKKNRGLKIKALANEVYLMWFINEISGFNYRYFMESLGLDYDIRFISISNTVGRY